ncbi:hypothetical protein PMKS-000731 [Pichia membranifaciens]|uniref:non-specific serine/threonine protein kinase n=1 Tax=Pichia membranifaciens TaxID=4926 RepID=A0A1Q2YCI9_9ASCO|nr:hypothetical protein PMKS-000731 [Pichia membranifaciens]
MPSNNFLTRLFKKDKDRPKTHSTGHEHSSSSSNHSHSGVGSSNSSGHAGSGDSPHSVKLSSASSSTSTIHPVDSHSHHPHLKLARFMEKREHHFFPSFEGHHTYSNNKSPSSSAKNLHVAAPKSPSTFTKPLESKFDDYHALVHLVSKYGFIPDNTVDLMKLLTAPDDSDVVIPEATDASTALIIGKGAGGSVYPLYDKTHNHLYAMKKLRLQMSRENWVSYENKLKNEFRIANKLHHQNLIRTYDLLQDNDLFIIVMDYAPFDFFTIVMAGVLTKHEIYCYFKQMCIGVSYMHSIGLAHRDLKLDNCVVDANGILKLVDFGSSVIFDMKRYNQEGESREIEKASGIMGSDPYLAPEVVTYPYYDPSLADVWSLAIIYCCMVLRRFPWRVPKDSDASYGYFSSPPGEVVDKNGHNKVVGPERLLKLLPTSSKALIESMLKIDPKERYTMKEVTETPFFANIENCHYDDYDSNRNRGTLVKGQNHTHHLITNKQFTEEHPDEVKREVERENAQAKQVIAQNNA